MCQVITASIKNTAESINTPPKVNERLFLNCYGPPCLFHLSLLLRHLQISSRRFLWCFKLRRSSFLQRILPQRSSGHSRWWIWLACGLPLIKQSSSQLYTFICDSFILAYFTPGLQSIIKRLARQLDWFVLHIKQFCFHTKHDHRFLYHLKYLLIWEESIEWQL